MNVAGLHAFMQYYTMHFMSFCKVLQMDNGSMRDRLPSSEA